MKSAFEVDDTLGGVGETSDEGLRFALESFVDPVDASVADMDVRGVSSEISIFFVDETDTRWPFGSDSSLCGASGVVADRGTVEKRAFASSSSDSSSSLVDCAFGFSSCFDSVVSCRASSAAGSSASSVVADACSGFGVGSGSPERFFCSQMEDLGVLWQGWFRLVCHDCRRRHALGREYCGEMNEMSQNANEQETRNE